jgi:phosphomannomutase
MSQDKIEFGTDGWRAVVADDFTYENVRAVAQGVANFLEGDSRPVAVAHDARFSAELFAREVTRVLAANGKRVILVDRPVPTPVASWTVIDRHTAGAVMVTASHNPAEFNGLKYKSDAGGSAAHELIAQIQEQTNLALNGTVKQMSFADAQEQGYVETIDARPAYMTQIGRMVDLPRLRNAGLKVLHEAMYGAGAGFIAAALEGGSTQVSELHCERNPSFVGMHPEPIARYMPEAVALMKQGGFDLCIANDGDADRVGIIDEHGRFVNQLEVAGLFAMYLLERKGWRGDIVRSLTSTNMLDALGEKFDVKVHETPVGFPYIGKLFVEVDGIFAAEESGGFAFRGHIPERDGILAGLLMAEMVVDYQKPLSELLEHLEELVGPRAYARHDIRFEREGYGERKQRVYAAMRDDTPAELAGSKVVNTRTDDGFKFYLEDGGWVLVRMSGTEPLMRVYSEAGDLQRVDELLAALEAHLNVTPQPAGAH